MALTLRTKKKLKLKGIFVKTTNNSAVSAELGGTEFNFSVCQKLAVEDAEGGRRCA